MSLKNLFVIFLSIETFVKASENVSISAEFIEEKSENNVADVFNGVYTECFMYLSYSCLQQKTLLYLRELNKLSEVSVIGEYVKFVKINETENDEISEKASPEDLTFQIDKAVDRFFDSHILKFNALGKEVPMPHTVDEFVGRKRKGGGGGGGGHGGGDDGGKKKMMMMAMMCMKMKFMMMVPAMMGMMGMMSFKGMMFSMMSFMISKMMLLMKILEKKGGGGGGGGGGDGGWAAGGGGGGGGWMPAGGQDYGGGGGGGGYDANAQWQRRSILDVTDQPIMEHQKLMGQREPIVSYVTPLIRYSNQKNSKSFKNSETLKTKEDQPKSRKKRGIVDMLQNAYIYWLNQVLGLNRFQKYQPKVPKYKVVNGMKYVYYPIRYIPKPKAPRELNPQNETKAVSPTVTPIATAEDFNKGEIVEGAVESRMTKKLQGFKDMVNDAIEDSPWQ